MILLAKPRHVATVFVMLHQTRQIDHRMTGPDDAVEAVAVASARQGRAGIERLVETADLAHDMRRKDHRRAGSEISLTRRMKRIAIPFPGEALELKAFAKPAAALEPHLRFGLKHHGHDRTGKTARSGAVGDALDKRVKPSAIRYRIVVDKPQPVALCLGKRAIAAEIQTGHGFDDISDRWKVGDGIAGAAVARCVIDHHEVDRRSGGLVTAFDKRLETAAQEGRAVAC